MKFSSTLWCCMAIDLPCESQLEVATRDPHLVVSPLLPAESHSEGRNNVVFVSLAASTRCHPESALTQRRENGMAVATTSSTSDTTADRSPSKPTLHEPYVVFFCDGDLVSRTFKQPTVCSVRILDDSALTERRADRPRHRATTPCRALLASSTCLHHTKWRKVPASAR